MSDTTTDSLPSVAGRRMQTSNADFERACLVLIGELQGLPTTDSALLAVLCEAVRCVREYGDERLRAEPTHDGPRVITARAEPPKVDVEVDVILSDPAIDDVERLTQERDEAKAVASMASADKDKFLGLAEEAMKVLAERDRLRADNARLWETLELAAATFRRYARIHAAKGEAGVEKAQANRQLAERMEDALADTTPVKTEPTSDEESCTQHRSEPPPAKDL